MQKDSYKIVSYKIKHDYNINDFLLSYRSLLQRTIDIIWDNIEWVEKWEKKYCVAESRGKKTRKYYCVKRLIQVIQKTKEFKKKLRDELLKDWAYASHYVDSAIKVAYSILNSWRRNYIKGERKRKKPTAKRLFVRVKETLYTYKMEKLG